MVMNGSCQPDLWVEYLSAQACWELLASTPVGRVGVLVDSAPEVYPVNYAVDGHSVVFRTDPGNKLRGLGRSPSVCFQIDSFDLDQRTGWSVLVKGRAEEVLDSGSFTAWLTSVSSIGRSVPRTAGFRSFRPRSADAASIMVQLRPDRARPVDGMIRNTSLGRR